MARTKMFRQNAHTSKAIFEILSENPDVVFTINEVATLLGGNPKTTSSGLHRLAVRPDVPIVRVGYGKFRYDSIKARELKDRLKRVKVPASAGAPKPEQETQPKAPAAPVQRFASPGNLLLERLYVVADDKWLVKDEEGAIYLATLERVSG